MAKDDFVSGDVWKHPIVKEAVAKVGLGVVRRWMTNIVDFRAAIEAQEAAVQSIEQRYPGSIAAGAREGLRLLKEFLALRESGEIVCLGDIKRRKRE